MVHLVLGKRFDKNPFLVIEGDIVNIIANGAIGL